MFLKSWVNFSELCLLSVSLPLAALLGFCCQLRRTPGAPSSVQLFTYRFNYCLALFSFVASLIYLYSRPRLIFIWPTGKWANGQMGSWASGKWQQPPLPCGSMSSLPPQPFSWLVSLYFKLLFLFSFSPRCSFLLFLFTLLLLLLLMPPCAWLHLFMCERKEENCVVALCRWNIFN